MKAEALGKMPFDEYLRIVALNWSTLKNMAKAPAAYLHSLTEPRQDTASMLVGRAGHHAILEPERFAAHYTVYEQRRQGKEWEAFESKAKKARLEVLTAKQYERVKAMAVAVRSDATALPYISKGTTEETYVWRVERPVDIDAPSTWSPGLHRWAFDAKGRMDFIRWDGSNPIGITDLKTTTDASPAAWGRAVVRLNYHAQAAWYVDGLRAVTGVEVPFHWVVVESEAPHIVQVYACPEETLELGRSIYLGLLDSLDLCNRERRWPGYATGVMDVVLPKWAYPEEDVADLDLSIKEED